MSFISRIWVNELNMMTRRCHYNIISIPFDDNHRLGRRGLKIGIRIASTLLRNRIGIYIDLSRRH